jgi:hypothetical protein
VTARKADRIAWIANDKGMRNVFSAAAPDFRAVRVSSYMKDDGVDTTQLSISDDGTTVIFTRGHDTNRDDWVASPEADPNGGRSPVCRGPMLSLVAGGWRRRMG